MKYDISKPERIRQANTNLALPDGQFEQNTAHRETYQSHGISRFERVRAANDKIGLPEGYGILVEDKRVSVEKPGVIGYNPRDLVWEDSVVQQVEHSINARLASSDDQILVVAVSH